MCGIRKEERERERASERCAAEGQQRNRSTARAPGDARRTTATCCRLPACLPAISTETASATPPPPQEIPMERWTVDVASIFHVSTTNLIANLQC